MRKPDKNAERRAADANHAAPYVVAFDEPEQPGFRLMIGTSDALTAQEIADRNRNSRVYHFPKKEQNQ